MRPAQEKIYAPEQAKILFEFWPETVDWFILGGVATSNEAQTIHQKYPEVKYIGFEPNLVMRKKAAPNFPGVSYPYALWKTDQELILCVPNARDIGSSVCREMGDTATEQTVIGRSLDSLSEELGPFTNCILWLDIEWAELAALKGATKLLTEDVVLINLEVMTPQQMSDIKSCLSGFGFNEIHRWGNTMPNKWDIIFIRKEA